MTFKFLIPIDISRTLNCSESCIGLVSNFSQQQGKGAVSYHIDYRVSVRVSKFTFGIQATRSFEPTNPELSP